MSYTKAEIQKIVQGYAAAIGENGAPMKIEIVGRGPSRQPIDPSRQTWYISTALMQKIHDFHMVRAHDFIFQLHDESLFEDWLPNDYRVKLMKPSAKLPEACCIMPDAIVQEFGPVFASSVSWMIAYAMDGMVESIHLNGIDLKAADDPLTEQRQSLAYMVGLARGQGIEITTNSVFFPLTWGRYPME